MCILGLASVLPCDIATLSTGGMMWCMWRHLRMARAPRVRLSRLSYRQMSSVMAHVMACSQSRVHACPLFHTSNKRPLVGSVFVGFPRAPDSHFSCSCRGPCTAHGASRVQASGPRRRSPPADTTTWRRGCFSPRFRPRQKEPVSVP